MKVLVCGGRTYGDGNAISVELSSIPDGPHVLIHGGCTGADTLASRIARELGWRVVQYEADWSLGASAGPRRNQLMLDHNPDIGLVIAFGGGSGTADMVKRAKKAGLAVRQVTP